MMKTRKRRTSTANSLKSCFAIGKSASIKEVAVEALRSSLAVQQADVSLADSSTIELTDLSASASPRPVRQSAVVTPSRSPRLSNVLSSPSGKTVSVIVEETKGGTVEKLEDLSTVTEQSSIVEPSSPLNVTSEPLLSTEQRH